MNSVIILDLSKRIRRQRIVRKIKEKNRLVLLNSFMIFKSLKGIRELIEEMEIDAFEDECYIDENLNFDLRKIKLDLFK